MKRIFRPFWSYDVKRTESWLNNKALSGYQLTEIHPSKGLFLFEAGNDPQSIHYHIGYAKSEVHSLPASISHDGWKEVCCQGNWFILSNEKPAVQLKCYPIREGIIKRNRNLLYVHGMLSVYIILTALLFLILGATTVLFYGGALSFNPFSLWITILIIGSILLIVAPFLTVRLYKANKQFW
ncbi:DUF2812 domain-containing protein [Virgibacillus salexigens]|uniref:DUF2812 domain-containing protein n=1 Tax=Virgibacillus salexigens TaxID=61016 RepID=UPI00190A00E0|nr:DUF2812 domain-containing protein [Virgibacillus salexigens]